MKGQIEQWCRWYHLNFAKKFVGNINRIKRKMVSTVKTIGLALPLKLLICNFYNVSSIKLISGLNSFFNVFYVPSKQHYKPIPCNKEIHRRNAGEAAQEIYNKNRNPTMFNIIRWVAGKNDSSTKRLMFQELFLSYFLAKNFANIISISHLFIILQEWK